MSEPSSQPETPQKIDQAAQPDSEMSAEAVVADDLAARLAAAEAAAQTHQDAWLRAKAETENIRRRATEESDKVRKFAVEKFAGDLLAVKDSLEAALATDDNVSVESLKNGVELTLKQLIGVFDNHGIAEVNPAGQKFDPNLHQAIAMVEGEGEPNSVAQVLQKGYCLNERVLRPAMVMVTKAADA